VNQGNQNAINEARQFNAGQTNAMATNAFDAQLNNNQFNSNGRNATNQFNANLGLNGAQNQLAAALGLGDLSTTGFNMGQAVNSGLAAAGGMERGLMQELMNMAAQQYGGFTGAGGATLPGTIAALQGAPVPQNTTSTTTGQPGIWDFMTAASTMFKPIFGGI
jgi:hypothetical protein